MMRQFQGLVMSQSDDRDAMITAATVEPRTSNLSRAASRRLMVQFDYDGETRNVEVHAVGRSTKDGSFVMRGYMPGAARPWRLFSVHKIENLTLTFDESEAPREGYTMGDKQMSLVLAQIAL